MKLEDMAYVNLYKVVYYRDYSDKYVFAKDPNHAVEKMIESLRFLGYQPPQPDEILLIERGSSIL
jgi:hypothetical protein